jgi:hypothetical protein
MISTANLSEVTNRGSWLSGTALVGKPTMNTNTVIKRVGRVPAEQRVRELTEEEATEVAGGMPATSDYKGPDHIGHTYF